ncbi:D-glycero-beta-D-manno-heptose-7-phosphate kinase [Hydrogenivirga sp. 128-5-R1-1]|uniref:D-glycero-beta-D-manno-heptose-7-phosphate kinase n=1 Tax=Hydrogenivirga sp. 128-5-R1-1 TaxID=392423 RepID=UPI00015F3747|nr:D-glycero-beta-D-manno-heptose-7-phosphate kinase [Hydrogenivirga sp. 128-5-R1-1]EDP76459.1 ADP-heptose synthase [Hydrogenivirga sp. 128-5-R1-1]
MELSRVEELLKRLKDIKVLVVGDVILDRYLRGKVERISPEAPVPIVEVEEEELRLGGAGNVASNLVALGVETYITGVVGEDSSGERLIELLKEKGIESRLFKDERPTTEKIRVVSMSQQLLRIDREDRRKVGGSALKHIREVILENDYDGVIVSDYAKGVVTHRVMEAIKDREVFCAIDPRPVNRQLYSGASLMTPNEKELRAMTDPLGEEGVETLGKVLKKELELETLVVTRGAKGMMLFGEEVRSFPARAREVYDVTGAGDTVIASLTAFHLAGATWEEACELANVCAGIVVGEFGTASVTPEELLRELDEKGE